MYVDNLLKPVEYQDHRSTQRSRSHEFLCVFVRMLLLEPVGWIHEMLHRHGPRAVLSLEQELTFLLTVTTIVSLFLFLRCTGGKSSKRNP